jgi:uncharacterized protein YndB with AHSA1/START domain
MKPDDETTLRLERLIPSPPELLFALFTDPMQLVKWWAPDGYEAIVDSLDVRRGGRWRVLLRRLDGGSVSATASGVYRAVEPPHRLAFTWTWEDTSGSRGHETEVLVSFQPVPGGTRLVIEHRGFESNQARDDHHRGWSVGLERIETIVSR